MDWSLRTLLVSACFFSANGVEAYPTPVDFDGSLLRWDINVDSGPISYEVVSTNDRAKSLFASAVDDAAQLWTEVPSSYFAFAQAEPDTKAQVTVHLDSADQGSEFSAGYAVFDKFEQKTPSHCDIHVTIDDTVSFAGFSKTILHELGHCVGLGHTLIPEAIMSYSLDKNAFALDVDDQAAITRLYPADGSKPKLPPGCAVLADRHKSDTWLIWLLLSIPGLVALGSRWYGNQNRV